MTSALRPVALGLPLLLCVSAVAQQVGGRFEVVGSHPGFWAIVPGGDLDLDGVPDQLFYSPPYTRTSPSRIDAHSGADGSQIWSITGTGFFGVAAASLGDVDGDGHPDVAISAPLADPGGVLDAGSVFVYSGKDTRLLWQVDGQGRMDNYGWELAAAGDVNQDGIPDLIVGSPYVTLPGSWRYGTVDVFSGNDGALLHSYRGNADDKLGRAVASVGDLDGDGHPDFIYGADEWPGGAGYADIHSGKDGRFMWRFRGTGSDQLGSSVANVGDLNGDGIDDILVGASNGAGGRGYVDIYSGRTADRLWRFLGEDPGDAFGGEASSAGDVNRDGVPDLLVSAPGVRRGSWSNVGRVYLYSGRDASELWRATGQGSYSGFGGSVAALGDIDGDGFPQIGIGAALDPSVIVELNAFMTPSAFEISAAAGGTIDYALHFPMQAANDGYLVLLSASGTTPFTFGVPIPLTVDPLMLASVTGLLGPLQSGFAGTLSGTATARASLTLPTFAIGGLAGVDLHLAAVAFAAGGLPRSSSAAIRLGIRP